MQSLIATGKVSRGYLGVNADTVTSEDTPALKHPPGTRGVMITDVSPDSPASRAGLMRGDVILSYNNRPVSSWEDFRLLIAETVPGAKVTMKISRDGNPQTVVASLDRNDEKPDELIPGVNVTPLTDELRMQLRVPARLDGLVVTSIEKDSPYADALVPQCVIVQIDREFVTSRAAAKAALGPGRHLLYVYYRGALRVARLEIK
jgi:S1-C subfamily serine protease